MSAGDVHTLFVPMPTWDPGSKPRTKPDGTRTKPREPGHLPPSAMKRVFLNANHRVHYQTKSAIVRAWRHAAKTAAQRAFHGYRFERIRLVAEFSKTRGGRYDAANLSPVAKAICDGLVDAGLVEDDSNEYVVGPDCRPGPPEPLRPGVYLTIEEL
jgi:crossover junction endodeoxyribonuclease RusA